MLILGTNSIKDTGYDVANSCRFQDSDSSEMSRAIASTGSNTIWTVSAWVKRVELGQSSPIFGTGDGGANNDARMVFFDAADAIECSYYNSGYTYEVTTNRLFRDVSAWYHICILFDSTQGTAANRIKIYVNGTQETSFATSSYPSEDAAFNFGNTSYTHYVNDMGGRNIRGSHYIAELVYIDGTASAVTNFGEFDSDSPTIWKPKDVSGLSVGTNGVYLDFEDSSNLGNAVDGGTDFTESNLDAQNQTTDTPTNNFCTVNSLDNYLQQATLSEGNTKITFKGASSVYAYSTGTFGVANGKWYWEVKATSAGNHDMYGISGRNSIAYNAALGKYTDEYGYYNYNGNYSNASSDGTYAENSFSGGNVTWTTGDIIGIALDLDSGTNTVKFYKNNALTGTVNIIAPSTGFYYPAFAQVDNQAEVAEVNFGNPSFSISSGNADADGYGNFEYAVPSGYYALCTKNLAEYG